MTERWDCAAKDMREHPAVDMFLKEIVDLCRKHGLVLSHEDTHGAFEINKLDQADERWAAWISAAHVDFRV